MILFSHISIAERDTLPLPLFHAIKDVLVLLYPPAPRLLPAILQFMRKLSAIISFASASLAVPLLASLQDGLCVWIVDESRALQEVDYDEVVCILFDVST